MTSTEIKLSPAMVTALKGATLVEGDLPRVSDDTKSQTVRGLATRGLSDLSGYLSAEGVEAAFQLGNDVRPVQDEPLADWERELLHSNPWEPKTGIGTNDDQTAAYIKHVEVTAPPVIESTPIGHDFGTTTPETDVPTIDAGVSAQIAKLLDKPVPVPNREDKRKKKFSLKAAASRLFQRNKQKRISKYGTTKYGEVTS